MTNICPNINCNKDFMYISELKRHLNNSYHCGKGITDIDLYILQKKTIKKTEEKTCIYCNTTYSKKSSLDRHIKNSKCTIEFKELKRQEQIEDLKNEIEKLKLQLQIQNPIQQPIHHELVIQQPLHQELIQQIPIQNKTKRKIYNSEI